MSEQGTQVSRRGMTPYTFALAAGVERSFDVEFDYFHVLTAPVTDLKVRFDDSAAIGLYEGVGLRVYGSSFTLSSATGQTVTVLAGFGHVFDGRASANVNVTATVAAGNTINDGGDVSCVHAARTQLLPQDLSRTYALLKNVSANTIIVRIGNVTVGAASGTPLEPGETLPYATTAAVYAWNPDAAVDVTINAASIQQV